MIKIMIVDDRPIFRSYLKSSIEWSNYGFSICAEARNGEEALELAKQELPDIVLTDINMPIMNGLELSENLIALYPEISIVLITGYSEFEYARKAIKIGVSDYILKPFEKEELILTLLKLKDNYQTAFEVTTSESDENNLLLDHLFRDMIYTSGVYLEPIIHQFKELETSYTPNRHLCIVSTFKYEKSQEAFILWGNTVKQLMRQMFDLNYYHRVINDYEGRIISIVGFDDSNHEVDWEQLYQLCLDEYLKIHALVNKHLDSDLVMGFGTVHQGFDGIRASYLEALGAVQSSYKTVLDLPIEYNNLPDENKKHAFYSAEINESLIRKLRENNLDEALALVDSIYIDFVEKEVSSDYAAIIFMGLISLVLSFITQSGKRIENVLINELDYVTQSSKYTQVKDQHLIIKALIKSTIVHFSTYKVSRAYKIAEKAKLFVQNNYMNSALTVSDLASNQYINETYLRSVFKKEVGVTISEYLTQVRMEKAKEMVQDDQVKHSDIAEAVGYNDAGYFSRAFKKYYGVSPSHYKNLK